MHAWRAAILGLCGILAPIIATQARADEGAMTLTSPAFADGAAIPAKYSLRGGDVSPELQIGGVPAHAKSLVLVVDDPDSPSGLWTHWLVWNISPKTTVIAEGKAPPGAVQGKNSFGNVRYDGPVPPSGTHHYCFHIYALDAPLNLPAGSNNDAVKEAMNNHIVGSGSTIGLYSAAP
jgi:Raf kinase inhibitor-like YbhB/YbcL family protein